MLGYGGSPGQIFSRQVLGWTAFLSTLSYCTNTDVGPSERNIAIVHFAGELVNERNSGARARDLADGS